METPRTLAAFRASIENAAPPDGLSLPLQALWWEAKGDWKRAHECAQDDPGQTGAAVHAYLHRVEGDLANARYWYDRAGRAVFDGTTEAEWISLATYLVG